MTKTVNIRRLKDFALNEMPKDWILRELLLSEHKEELDALEFVTKAEVWLKLARGKAS